MKSDKAKVLHELCGRPLLGHVLSACRLAGVDRILVVVGHDMEAVIARFKGESDLTWIEQTEQKGTGHAVSCCRSALEGFEGNVLVIAGDMPLVQRPTFSGLFEARRQSGDAVAMATTELEDPTGYGRIIRDADGQLEAIVEHNDCTVEQREVREVNPSYYCFDSKLLFEALEKVEPSGSKGEYYITDVIRILKDAGHGVSAPIMAPAEDATGVNSRLDLATVSRIMQDRIQLRLMDDGVTIVDPDNTWIEADVSIGRDAIVYPFSFLRAGASVGARCTVGPFACIGNDEVVPDGASVGPMFGNGASRT